MYNHISGQIIATSPDLTPNGGFTKGCFLISGKPRLVKHNNLARFISYLIHSRFICSTVICKPSDVSFVVSPPIYLYHQSSMILDMHISPVSIFLQKSIIDLTQKDIEIPSLKLTVCNKTGGRAQMETYFRTTIFSEAMLVFRGAPLHAISPGPVSETRPSCPPRNAACRGIFFGGTLRGKTGIGFTKYGRMLMAYISSILFFQSFDSIGNLSIFWACFFL